LHFGIGEKASKRVGGWLLNFYKEGRAYAFGANEPLYQKGGFAKKV
jgi:hypothetical protein